MQPRGAILRSQKWGLRAHHAPSPPGGVKARGRGRPWADSLLSLLVWLPIIKCNSHGLVLMQFGHGSSPQSHWCSRWYVNEYCYRISGLVIFRKFSHCDSAGCNAICVRIVRNWNVRKYFLVNIEGIKSQDYFRIRTTIFQIQIESCKWFQCYRGIIILTISSLLLVRYRWIIVSNKRHYKQYLYKLEFYNEFIRNLRI